MSQLIVITPMFFLTAIFFMGVSFCVGRGVLKSNSPSNKTFHTLSFGFLGVLNFGFGAMIVADYLKG